MTENESKPAFYPSRPDVYVAVSSPIDTSTYLATGPASLGALQTFGLIH